MDYGEAVWSSDVWRAQAVAWLDERLAEVGLRRSAGVDHLHVRPWATAIRAPTTNGVVWMKAAGPATAFEVELYELLHKVAPDYVARPIATDSDRAWMVLEDGGPVLSDLLGGDELVDAMGAAVARYAELQRLVAPHADELVRLGATDMRPRVLPARFEQALELVSDPADRERLKALRPEVERWCEELAAAPGGASIDHNDLYPSNVFAGPPPRVYDWGDSVVAHPFASMLVPLDFMHRYVPETGPGDPRVPRLRDAYLESFADLAPHAELVRTMKVARRLALIPYALTWDRTLRAMRREDEPEDWAAIPASLMTSLLG